MTVGVLRLGIYCNHKKKKVLYIWQQVHLIMYPYFNHRIHFSHNWLLVMTIDRVTDI